jgi:hypothetical protein
VTVLVILWFWIRDFEHSCLINLWKMSHYFETGGIWQKSGQFRVFPLTRKIQKREIQDVRKV